MPDRPRGLLRLNPGNLPEAEALEELTHGLIRVRALIDRETVGAVSPRRQLLAIDMLMQRHHDAIAAMMGAASERHARACSASDLVRLVSAIVEHATMAMYWLNAATSLSKLPSPERGRPDLSRTKSRERRAQISAVIDARCTLAEEFIQGLEDIARTEGLTSDVIPRVLATFRLQMLCVRIMGTLHAATAEGRTHLSPDTLRSMLRELDAVRIGPGFSDRSHGDRDVLWATASQLYVRLGDIDRVRTALRERRALTVGRPAARARLLVDTATTRDTYEEKLAILHELNELGATTNLGPVFSRERIGWASILGDSLWWMPGAADPASAAAAPTIDEAFACHSTWLYGQTSRCSERIVALVCDWRGRGLVRWRSGGRDRTAPFTLDPDLVARFYVSMEAMQRMDRGSMTEVTSSLDTTLGPLLFDAGASNQATRLRLGGVIGSLPVLLTMVDGLPLGAAPQVAYAHPNANVSSSEASTQPFDLLVIDDAFDRDSLRVRVALQRAAEGGATYTKLAFNSDAAGQGLDHDVLTSALQTASRAIFFCHCESVAGIAGAASIVTGDSGRLLVETIATLDLHALEELVIVGCSSGRPDPFVGDITVAHATAVAGARQILYSLWPLRPHHAADFVVALAEARSAGTPTPDFLADQYRVDRVRASSFVIMRP